MWYLGVKEHGFRFGASERTARYCRAAHGVISFKPVTTVALAQDNPASGLKGLLISWIVR